MQKLSVYNKMNGTGRRQTLAGLSPNQLNTRASIGPARIAKESRLGRQSSVFGLAGKGLANNALPKPSLSAGLMPRRSVPFEDSWQQECRLQVWLS